MWGDWLIWWVDDIYIILCLLKDLIIFIIVLKLLIIVYCLNLIDVYKINERFIYWFDGEGL